MDILKRSLILAGVTLCLCGCQFGYILHTAKGQLSLFSSRVDLETALKNEKISEKEKEKIKLVQKVREFATQKIGLKETKNYSQYVHLDRPYVTYVVSAAEQKKLKTHEWNYPIVGKMPYKGFFDEALAKEEERELQKKGLDTYLRGVSAYSTLGWFNDPLLSSMTSYRDDVLVNTIIHETVHTTLYIKNAADFNERMAVFIANKATEDFYLELEGPNSETIKIIKNENEDELKFSIFISAQLRDLEKWYQQSDRTEEERQKKFQEIKDQFEKSVKPHLKTKTYLYFSKIQLNNARLLVYKTYVSDLSEFEELFEKVGRDYRRFLDECKQLMQK